MNSDVPASTLKGPGERERWESVGQGEIVPQYLSKIATDLFSKTKKHGVRLTGSAIDRKLGNG